jgi:UDP-glucose 4-epimerase
MARGANGKHTVGGASLGARARSDLRRPARRCVVAVTGARTFLGANLVGVLEEDETITKVVVLDVRNAQTAGAKTCYYEVDLTQSGVDARLAEILNAEEVDTVVHLAFAGNPTQATAWAHELESLGTMNLLNACRKQRVARVVMGSTTLVYGPNPGNPNFLTEAHPARGLYGAPYIDDKLDAEEQVRRFGSERPGTFTLILRLAPILGPTVDNFVVRWLSRRMVPTALGFDPLVQFLHEVDAVAGLRLAIESELTGTFNIVSRGVLPLSTVIKLAGRMALPLPYGLLRRLTSLMWLAQLGDAPPAFVAALRYLCIADGERAERELGFVPAYSSRDAVLDFEGALRLREARLLQEVVQ